MKFKIDLQITNKGRYPVDGERLFGVVEQTLGDLAGGTSCGVHLPGSRLAGGRLGNSRVEVSVLFVDKEEMAEFNWQYHDTKGPTDVLSFPYMDPESAVSDERFVNPPDTGVVLGDLIVCYPVAEEEAQKQGKTAQEMVEFYIDHGLHHLLGVHHD